MKENENLPLERVCERETIDLGTPIFWIVFLILVILFSGDPDLMDAILYRLTNGEIKLPAK